MIQLDCICALATPPGMSGLAVIRISGQDAISISSQCFKGKISLLQAESHRIYFGKFISDGILIDEVTASIFLSPHSYTGENIVEFGCHGSMIAVDLILTELCKKGARPAAPGEFTKRAFMNGKT